MQGGEQLGGPAGDERIDVEHHRQQRERDEQRRHHARGEPALPREVPGEEGQHEQAEVARQHRLVAEPGGAGLDRQPGPDRERQDDAQLPPRRRAGVLGVLREEHELLPQPLGVLAGELVRDGVEVAHALDRDEEGLVVVEPGGPQVRDLFAQVVLELVHVGRGDRLAALDPAAPPPDLGLLLRVQLHHAHRSVVAGGCCAACHTCRSASATTVHCSCRSASAARPEAVIA